MSVPRKLDYPFAPPPRWVFEYVRAGTISEQEGWLISTLFQLAKTTALLHRAEGPKVTLDELLAYVDARKFRRVAERERARDALRKRIARGSERGLFSYRLEGSPTAGYRYVFALSFEPPTLSGSCPAADDGSRPAADRPQSGSASAIERAARQAASGSKRGQVLHSRPEGDTSRPEAEQAASARQERDRATAGDASRPAASDASRKHLQPPRANLHLEASAVDAAHAREPDQTTEELLASTDRLLALVRESDDLRARIDAAREAQHREQRALTLTWVASLPDIPRQDDDVSERDLVASLVAAFDAVLVDETGLAARASRHPCT